MRLSCPECQTEYEVPDAALAGRPRTLRCANCGKTWKTQALEATSPAISAAEIAPAGAQARPEPVWGSEADSSLDTIQPEAEVEDTEAPSQGEAAVAPAADEPLLSATRLKMVREAQAAKEAERPSNTGLKLSVLAVIVVIVLVLAEHRAVTAAWPPSARLFNALGLH